MESCNTESHMQDLERKIVQLNRLIADLHIERESHSAVVSSLVKKFEGSVLEVAKSYEARLAKVESQSELDRIQSAKKSKEYEAGVSEVGRLKELELFEQFEVYRSRLTESAQEQATELKTLKKRLLSDAGAFRERLRIRESLLNERCDLHSDRVGMTENDVEMNWHSMLMWAASVRETNAQRLVLSREHYINTLAHIRVQTRGVYHALHKTGGGALCRYDANDLKSAVSNTRPNIGVFRAALTRIVSSAASCVNARQILVHDLFRHRLSKTRGATEELIDALKRVIFNCPPRDQRVRSAVSKEAQLGGWCVTPVIEDEVRRRVAGLMLTVASVARQSAESLNDQARMQLIEQYERREMAARQRAVQLEGTITESVSTIRTLQDSHSNCLAELELMKAQSAAQTTELSTTRDALQKANAELKALSQELTAASESMEHERTLNSESLEEHAMRESRLQAELGRLLEENTSADKRIAELTEAIELQKSRNDDLRKTSREVSDARSVSETVLRREIEHLLSKCLALETRLDSDKTLHTSELAALQLTVDSLRGDCDDKSRKINELESRGVLDADLLACANSELNSVRNELRCVLEQTAHDRANLDAEVATLIEANSARKSEHTRTTRELEELQSRHRILEAAMADLKAAQESHEFEARAKHQTEILELRNEIDRLKTEFGFDMDELKARHDTTSNLLQIKLETASCQLSDSLAKLTDAESQCALLRRESEKSKLEHDSVVQLLQEKLTAADHEKTLELERARVQQSQLTSALEVSENKLAVLRRAHDMRPSRAEDTNEILKLKKALDEQRQENIRQVQTVEALRKQVERLTESTVRSVPTIAYRSQNLHTQK